MQCCAILVNYKGAEDTAQAARSVLADEPDVELIVIDNSVDEQEFARLAQLLPSKARLIPAAQNLGFGRACNLAFNETAADFIFLVNPDVRVLPGCIAALASAMRDDNLIGAVAPRQYLDDSCKWLLPPSWFPTPLRAWATEMAMRNSLMALRVCRAQRAEALRYWTASHGVTQRALSGGALMVRRSVVSPTEPLFDPRFFMYFEDSDLCLRLKQKGFRLAMVPQARAVHRWRNQSHKAELMEQAASQYFEKHGGVQNRWLKKARVTATGSTVRPMHREIRLFSEHGLVIPEVWAKAWVL
jgi:GT2 family glycosyltransferase